MRGKKNTARRAVGLGLALAAATAGALATGPQAVAAGPTPSQFVLRPLDPIALGPATTGAWGSGIWFNTNATSPVRATLRIDVRQLAKVAKVSFSPECVVTAGVATCDETLRPDGVGLAAGANVTFSALPGAKPGASGHYTVSGVPDVAGQATISGGTGTVYAGAPVLKTAPLVAHKGLKVGSVVSEPVTVTNTGDLASAGSEVFIQLTPGLDFAQHFRNCEYWHPGGNFNSALCHFGGTVRPGETVALATPLRLKVLPTDLYASAEVVAMPDKDPAFPAVTVARRPVKGPVLGLKVLKPGHATAAPATHLGVWQEMVDDAVLARIDARNTADFGVWGAHASGAAGTVVPVTVGAFNRGPATVWTPTVSALRFTVPAGTTVVKAPAACHADTAVPGSYVCDFSSFPVAAGTRAAFTFRLRIDTVIRHATGRVDLLQKLSVDPNPADDTAWVTVN